MNCLCNPPQLAVLKTCNNERNPGKQYFSCPNPNQSARCKLFSWVGASMPMSLAFGRNRFPSKSKKSADANKSTSPQKVNGKFEAKLLVHEIIEGPPVEIWLSIQCPTTPVVSDLFSRLPPGKSKFNNGLKMWVFNFDQYERIKYEFTTPPFDAIYLPDLVKFLAKGLANFQKKFNKLSAGADPPLNLTPLIRSKILPFQLETVKFVVRRGGRALLGDEMGCGKTLQAISIMMHYRQHWPVLIVVPSSLMKQWPDEILNYAGDMVRPTDIKTIGQSSKLSTGLITIITYKVMENLVGNKLLSPEQFGVVIADESHNLKNKDSQRSQAIIPFLQKATVAICMTGTPAVNRPVELYSQLNGILPEVFNEYKEFVYRYCDAKTKGNLPGLNVSGSSNEQELNLLLTSLVMVRRTKDQVLKELPEKRREIRIVDPDPEYLPQLRAIQAQSKRLEDQLQNNPQMDPTEFQKLSNEKQQLLTQLYGVTGFAKIKAIKAELVKLIEESRAERGGKRAASTVPLADTPGNSSDSDLDSFAPQKGPKKHPFDHDPAMFDDTQVMTLDSPDQEATQKLDLHAHQPSFKRKNDSTIATAKSSAMNSLAAKGTSRAPILLELEDDFMNCDDIQVADAEVKRETKPVVEVQDLCDSDSSALESAASNSPSHKRVKKSLSSKANEGVKTIGPAVAGGTADSSDDDGFLTANEATADEGGGCYWEDSSSDCDFNLSDIKNGKTNKSNHNNTINTAKTTTTTNKATNHTDRSMNKRSEEKGVFSLFDQRAQNQAKRKKSTKSITAANKKNAIPGPGSKGNKAGKKRAVNESDGEEDQENESDEEDEVSDYDPTKRPTSQLERVGQKIIVFFHHKNVLSAIEDSLLKLRVKYVKIDGSTSQKNRGKLVEQFQNDNVTEVALLSITACGVGLNLTRANVALFGELNWSLGAVLQAEDRIHRLGQVAKVVRIIYMIARGTLDENIWDQLQNKHQVVGATVGTSGKPNYGGGMSIDSSSNHNNNTNITTNNHTSNNSNTSNTAITNATKPAITDMRAYLSSAAQAQPALPPPPPPTSTSLQAPVPLHTSSNGSYNPTTTGSGYGGYGGYGSNPVGVANGMHNNTVNNRNAYAGNAANVNSTSANSTSGNHSTSNTYGSSAYDSHTNITNGNYGAPANTSINTNGSSSNSSNLAQGPPQRSTSINHPYNTTSSSLPATGYHHVNANASSSAAYGNNIATNSTSHPSNHSSNMGAPVNPPANPNQPTTSSYGHNVNAGYNSLSTNNAIPPSRGYSYPPATTNIVSNSSTSYSNNPMHHGGSNLTNESKPAAYAAPKPALPAPSVTSLPPGASVPPAASFVGNINGPQEEFAYSASTQASHSSEATSAESKGSDHNHNQTTGSYSGNNNVSNSVSNNASGTRNTYGATRQESCSNQAAMPVPQREAMTVPSGYSSITSNASGYTINSSINNSGTNSAGYNIAARAPAAGPGQAVYQVPSVQTPLQQITPTSINPVHSAVPTFPSHSVPYQPTHINTANIRGTTVTPIPIAPVPTSSIHMSSTIIPSVPVTATNITPVDISTSANKAPLPPEMLARIEANRLAAQARLAAARQQKNSTILAPGAQTNTSSASVISNNLSNVPLVVPSNIPAVPAAMAMSPANKSYPPNTSSTSISTAPFSVGSPVALQAVLQSRQATANVPPGAVNGANAAAARMATSHYNNNTNAHNNATAATNNGTYSGYGASSSVGASNTLPPNTFAPSAALPTQAAQAAHVFSTGRGTSIPVSDAKMQQAAALLNSAVPPTGVPRVVPGHTAPALYPSHGGAYLGYSNGNHTGQPVTTMAAPTITPAVVVVPPSATGPMVSAGGASAATPGTVVHPSTMNVTTTAATPAATSTTTSTTAYTAGTLYFDGTAQSSLHRGGAGYQLFASNGRTLRENGVRMTGTCSSNQAEYVGLIQGLTAALHSGVQDLQVYGDSEVVIKQMLGIYPVRNPALQGMFTRAKALLGRFRRIQLQWIPKEKNSGANALSQRALHQPETVSENCDWFVSSVVS